MTHVTLPTCSVKKTYQYRYSVVRYFGAANLNHPWVAGRGLHSLGSDGGGGCRGGGGDEGGAYREGGQGALPAMAAGSRGAQRPCATARS